MVSWLLLVKLPGKLFWKKKISYRASGLKRIFPLSLIRGNLKMTMHLLRTSIPHIYRLSKNIGSIWNPNHDLERRYGKSSKAKEKGRENCLKFATFRERGRLMLCECCVSMQYIVTQHSVWHRKISLPEYL